MTGVRYELATLVGEGSYGRVFRGRALPSTASAEASASSTTTAPLDVALKLINKSGRTAAELHSLRTEFAIQRHLAHVNVVRIIDGYETPNEIVSVAEYVGGGHLADWLQRHRELNAVARDCPVVRDVSVAFVETLAVDLFSAVHYLHCNRILHRDVKPQNVLIAEPPAHAASGRPLAKLCDFGFARSLSVHTHVLTSIKGTPLYMAPELIEERPYDQAADIWSIGCLVYECIYGVTPFATANLFQLIRRVRYEAVPFPDVAVVNGNDEADYKLSSCIRLLKAVLVKDPQKRLVWPELTRHAFIVGKLTVEGDAAATDAATVSDSDDIIDVATSPTGLTRRLQPVECLQKAIQRQTKAAEMSERCGGAAPGSSHTLIRLATRAARRQAERQAAAAAVAVADDAEADGAATAAGMTSTAVDVVAGTEQPFNNDAWCETMDAELTLLLQSDTASDLTARQLNSILCEPAASPLLLHKVANWLTLSRSRLTRDDWATLVASLVAACVRLASISDGATDSGGSDEDDAEALPCATAISYLLAYAATRLSVRSDSLTLSRLLTSRLASSSRPFAINLIGCLVSGVTASEAATETSDATAAAAATTQHRNAVDVDALLAAAATAATSRDATVRTPLVCLAHDALTTAAS